MSDNPTPSTEKGSISVGDLSNNAGVAIGENAHAEVHYHYTYIERPSPHIPYLAPSLPPHHVPRQSVLGQLVQMLCDGSHDRIAVRGMGGLGKTTTAIALCHDKKVLECFTDGILWATLGPNPHVMVAQAAWAEELGVEFSTLTDAEARAIRLRSLLYDKCCLLVLDDTWDTASLDLMSVGGPRCVTLVTTRTRKIAQKVGTVFELATMEAQEAITLLNKWAAGYNAGSSTDAMELIERLGRLPLALRLTGAQAQDSIRWSDLLARFRDEQGADLSLLDMDDPSMRDESLALTFDLSFERLNTDLQMVFLQLGVFASGREAPFNEAAVEAVFQMTPAVAAQSLLRLARAALIDRVEQMYILHPLVADYARSKLEERARAAAAARHREHYLHVTREAERDWQYIEKTFLQIQLAWSRVPHDDAESLCAWAMNMQEFFHRHGYWQRSLEWLELAEAAARTKNDRRNQALCLGEIGWLHLSLGKHDLALELFQESLAIQQEVGDIGQEARLRARLAYLYLQAGDLKAAQREAQISENLSLQTNNAAGLAEAHHIQGLVSFHLGNFAEALTQYQLSLTAEQEAGNDRLTAITIQNIGRLYEQQGDMDRAQYQYEEALRILHGLGDKAVESAVLLSLARILDARSLFDRAEETYQSVLAILRSMGNIYMTANGLAGLGHLRERQQRLDEAKELYSQSLDLYRIAKYIPGQAQALWNIGRMLGQQGQKEQAITSLTESLEIYDKMGIPEAAQVRQALEELRAATA